ncbi:MAG: hypothetical protein Q9214_000961 [Letrouitia sp. 1 TL-2023]
MEKTESSPAFAPLESVSYAGVVGSEPQTLSALRRAVLDQGFFYLVLDDPVAKELAHDVQTLFAASCNLFNLPLDEKMQFDTKILAKERNYGEAPPLGLARDQMLKDGHELFLVPRDILFESQPDLPAFACPPPLYQEKDTLKSFTVRSQQICAVILAALSKWLPTEGTHASLEAVHHLDEASTTAIGLLRYPARAAGAPEAGHIAHTDVGSLTLLFTAHAGLQVEDPHAFPGASWLHVAPQPGVAVVNIGDALRFLSGRAFRSCLHRVLPNTGPDDRYSIAYFLRPGVETMFSDANGRVCTSLEWHNRKFETFQSTEAGKMQRILQGTGEKVMKLTGST